MDSMSVAEWRKHLHQPVRKYRNIRVEVDGRKFDSKLEAKRYEELKQLGQLGQVAWFTTQVPFRLPGGIIYRADFLVVWGPNPGAGGVTVEDCKGARTRVSINKIKQVEEIYGFKVEIITRERYRK